MSHSPPKLLDDCLPPDHPETHRTPFKMLQAARFLSPSMVEVMVCVCISVCVCVVVIECFVVGPPSLSLTHTHKNRGYVYVTGVEVSLCFVGLEVYKYVDVYAKQECIALIVPF